MRRREVLAVMAGCAAASLAAIVWSWTHDAMLNYGDAVAHLHIARRLFDSHRPGLTQLGSVWLPLPHLVMAPFVAVYAWWANGIAGLIPSALAWSASCYGLYRLLRKWLKPAPAILGLAFFALNPNLLYLQTTAMTEPLFVCEMIWAALWLVEWRANLDSADWKRRNGRLIWLIAMVLIAAIYTRYDGWIIAFLAWTAMGIALLRRGRLRNAAFWLASVLVVATPIAWCVYNAVAFGDWLDFARGPYSAKAIELRTATPGSGPPHPGWHNPWVSLIFFSKAALMDAAAVKWGGVMLFVGMFGTVWAWLTVRRKAFVWSLLLWVPVPFYAYSISYGSVPIFLPVWWPHSYYNTRYGMELLPALALAVAFVASFVLASVNECRPQWTRGTAWIIGAIVVLNAIQLLHERPIVYVEGTKNIEARWPLEQQIPPVLHAQLAMHPGGPVLMNTSVYPNLVAFAGIPLRQTINESDKEFYWAALAAPAKEAAVVLAFDGDEIDRAVKAHPQGLRAVQHFIVPWQPAATLYVSDTWQPEGSTGTPVR